MYECCCAGLFNNASGSQCRFWSGDGVGQSGFIVADQNDTPITPNDLNSVIPFRLDAAAAANVTLRAWPISITGQKPTEGPFSALGYLRVDYQ